MFCETNEKTCSNCIHTEVCSMKATFLNAMNAVKEVNVPDKNHRVTPLKDINWIEPVALKCKHYREKVPTTR